ncbi:MAG: hypothetical protein K6G61_07685 [Solobacterium sp.]|nr:hypothetical protein [Solobacterium sp.]
MELEELRNAISAEQKNGAPFIMASIVIWAMITAVCLLEIPVLTRNLLVFCCAAPLLPLAWIMGKVIKVDIFGSTNPLSKLGLLFTMNQMLYLLIVMWVYSAVPDKMVMVYAMVFGAHLLPYSWLYKSKAYMIFAVFIPFAALLLGLMCSAPAVAAAMAVTDIVFVLLLLQEVKKTGNRKE